MAMFGINVCILIGGTGKRQQNCNLSPFLGEIQCEAYFELISRKTVFFVKSAISSQFKARKWQCLVSTYVSWWEELAKEKKLQFESLPGRNSVWNVFWAN